jgi:hypothetical protein
VIPSLRKGPTSHSGSINDPGAAFSRWASRRRPLRHGCFSERHDWTRDTPQEWLAAQNLSVSSYTMPKSGKLPRTDPLRAQTLWTHVPRKEGRLPRF